MMARSVLSTTSTHHVKLTLTVRDATDPTFQASRAKYWSYYQFLASQSEWSRRV